MKSTDEHAACRRLDNGGNRVYHMLAAVPFPGGAAGAYALVICTEFTQGSLTVFVVRFAESVWCMYVLMPTHPRPVSGMIRLAWVLVTGHVGSDTIS